MKIAFVVFEDENLGVASLSHYLKKHGHTVDLIFNPKQFHKAYARNDFLARVFNWQSINLDQLAACRPDLVAFSCVTATYQWALQFAAAVKQRMDIPIIFGGTHPTLVPEEVMKQTQVDMVCVGEGEHALLELADAFDRGERRNDINNIWFRAGNDIVKNPVGRLEQNIDLFESDREMFFRDLPSNYRKYPYFTTGRGCPFNCSFCGNEQKRKIYQGCGKYVRQKSVPQAIKELKELKDRFKAKRICFVDDILTVNRKWFSAFIDEYKKRIGLPFTCFIHPKFFDVETATLLKEGGCTLIWYGIQTGDETIRKKILNRPESNEEIINTARICNESGLCFMIDHIFDIPGDDDINRSVFLYNTIRPKMINCYNLLYFPLSKMIEHGLDRKMLTGKDVERINQGKCMVYQTGNNGGAKGNYRNHALFLTAVPIMPAFMVKRMAGHKGWMKAFSSLPPSLIIMIKIILNIRIGHGFLPFAVLKTELFWTMKYLLRTFKKTSFRLRKGKTTLNRSMDMNETQRSSSRVLG